MEDTFEKWFKESEAAVLVAEVVAEEDAEDLEARIAEIVTTLKIRNIGEERFAEAWAKAILAGQAAGDACVPTPVGFYSADLNGKPLSETTVENEGLCGGAYLQVRPATSRFVRWLKHNKIGSKGVYGGWEFSLPYNYRGQSAERYAAHAHAACDVLREELAGDVKSFSVREYLT